MALQLSSSDIKSNGMIPERFTCDGENVSPPLHWNGIPAGAKSLVLIMDDPDAPNGVWTHWVLFDIPTSTAELPETAKPLPAGTKQGTNSWGNIGYGGPCPPDREHRYFFKLYALDHLLLLKTGASRKEVEEALDGHIVGQAQLMARYDRAER